MLWLLVGVAYKNDKLMFLNFKHSDKKRQCKTCTTSLLIILYRQASKNIIFKDNSHAIIIKIFVSGLF